VHLAALESSAGMCPGPVHNPLLECLQIGATIRRVAESKLRKRDEDEQGLAAGAAALAFGLVEEVPSFANPST